MNFNKKSQSQVITVILLILITIVLVVMLSGFAINFVKSKLSESNCLDVTSKIEFTDNTKYTCFDSINQKVRVQVHVGDITEEIQGFKISVDAQGSSQEFTIINNTQSGGTNSIVYESQTATKLYIPGINSEKTYELWGIAKKPDYVSIYPILIDGKSCEASDSIQFLSICNQNE